MNTSTKSILPLVLGITLLSGNVVANSTESEDFFSKKALAKTEIILTNFESEKYTLNLSQSLLDFGNAKVQCQKILKKMACLEAIDRAFTSLAKTQYSMTRKSMFQASIRVNIHDSTGVIPFKKAIEAEGVTKFLSTSVNEDLNQLFQLYSALEKIIEQATTIDRVLESTGYRYDYGYSKDSVGKPFEITRALSGSNDYFTNRTLAENFLKRVDVVAPQVEVMMQLLSNFRTVSTRSSAIGARDEGTATAEIITARILDLGQKLRRKGLRVVVGNPFPISRQYNSGSVEGFASAMSKHSYFEGIYNSSLAPVIPALQLLLNSKPESEVSRLLVSKGIYEIKINLTPYCVSGERQLLICPPSGLSTDDFIRDLKAKPDIKD